MPDFAQLKSVFELLISTGVIRLDDDETQEETAMLVKKPLQGFACASCETKLKNVSQKPGNYAQWKKMPARDPLDRLPRAGQGFSKILQSIKTPRDAQWDDEQQLNVINTPSTLLNKGSRLTKSTMLIPQPVQLNESQYAEGLPKLGNTPRKNE